MWFSSLKYTKWQRGGVAPQSSQWIDASAIWYEKLEWCGYPTVKKCDDLFGRSDRITVYDRWTDRQTDRHLVAA